MIHANRLLMPVVFGDKVYGRVTKFYGTKLAGCYPIVEFTTPGGSKIKTGVIHLHNCADLELESLYDFEKDAIEKGKLAYEIPKEEMKEVKA